MPVQLLAILAKPWVKYVAGAIAAALIIFFIVHKWHAFEESLRQEGREQAYKQVAQVVEQNDKNNRKLETGLSTVLGQYGDRLDKSLSRMNANSQQHVQTVTKIIEKQPQIFRNEACNTPKEVLDERNKIRDEGPSQ
jgi:hypothetical protein